MSVCLFLRKQTFELRDGKEVWRRRRERQLYEECKRMPGGREGGKKKERENAYWGWERFLNEDNKHRL